SVRPTRELSAFTATAVSAVFCFGLYAAIKAAYVSTQFGTFIEERNLIYLTPVLFAGTALWLDRRRLRLVPLAAAAGFACYVILATPYALDNVPYAEAYGLSIVQLSNRDLSFAPAGVEWLVVGVLLVGIVLLLVPRVRPGRRAAGALVAVTAGLVLAWNLTGEIAGSNFSNTFSRQQLGLSPQPPDWLDRATGGQGVLFLGQGLDQGKQLKENLVEFWNRSLKQVWSLDGTAPGPVPTLTPKLADVDGRLSPDPGFDYVMATPGIDLVGTQVPGDFGQWQLWHIQHPLRTAESAIGLYSDGWSGPKLVSYNRYSTPGGRAGSVVVNVSRVGANGIPAPPGHVTIRVGTLVVGLDSDPASADPGRGDRLAALLAERLRPLGPAPARCPAQLLVRAAATR